MVASNEAAAFCKPRLSDYAVFLSSGETQSLPYRGAAKARNADNSSSGRPNTLTGRFFPFPVTFIFFPKEKARQF